MNFQISHDHNPSYSISRWVQSETYYYTLSLCLCLTLCMCLTLCLPLCLLLCLSLCLSVTLSLSRAMKMLMEAVLRWHSDQWHLLHIGQLAPSQYVRHRGFSETLVLVITLSNCLLIYVPGCCFEVIGTGGYLKILITEIKGQSMG